MENKESDLHTFNQIHFVQKTLNWNDKNGELFCMGDNSNSKGVRTLMSQRTQEYDNIMTNV